MPTNRKGLPITVLQGIPHLSNINQKYNRNIIQGFRSSKLIKY